MEQRSKILVVEDKTKWQAMLSALLTQAGYEVRNAYGHGQALFEIARERIDLVILDLDLPGSHLRAQQRFEGEDLLDALKAKGIFTIIVTPLPIWTGDYCRNTALVALTPSLRNFVSLMMTFVGKGSLLW